MIYKRKKEREQQHEEEERKDGKGRQKNLLSGWGREIDDVWGYMSP